jgi:hypothetical protein
MSNRFAVAAAIIMLFSYAAAQTASSGASDAPITLEEAQNREFASLLRRVGSNPAFYVNPLGDGSRFNAKFSVQEPTPDWDFVLAYRVAGTTEYQFHDLYWDGLVSYEASIPSALEQLRLMECHVVAKTAIEGLDWTVVIQTNTQADFTFIMPALWTPPKPSSFFEDSKLFQYKATKEFTPATPKPYSWGSGLRIIARSKDWKDFTVTLSYRSGLNPAYSSIRLDSADPDGVYVFDLPLRATQADSVYYNFKVEKTIAGYTHSRLILNGQQDFAVQAANSPAKSAFDPGIVTDYYSGARDLESGIIFWIEADALPEGFSASVYFRRWDIAGEYVEHPLTLTDSYYSFQWKDEQMGLGMGLDYFYLIRDNFNRPVLAIMAKGGQAFRTTIQQKL